MNSAQFLEQDLDSLLKTVLASTNEDFWLIGNDTLAFRGRRHRHGHRPRRVNITLQRLRPNRGRPDSDGRHGSGPTDLSPFRATIGRRNRLQIYAGARLDIQIFDPRDFRRSDVSPAKAICPAPYRLVPQPTDFPHPGRRGQVGTLQTTGLFIGALGFRGPRDAKRTRGRGSLNRGGCRLRRVYPQTSPRKINL